MKKNVFLGMIMLASVQLHAQQSIKIDHIGLAVKNVDTSAAFYSKILGLDSIPTPWPGRRIKWFSIGNNVQLHLIEYPANTTLPVDSNHFSFSVHSIENFIEKLNKANIIYFDGDNVIGQIDTRPDGVHQIYFKDPDGYEVEVNDRIH